MLRIQRLQQQCLRNGGTTWIPTLSTRNGATRRTQSASLLRITTGSSHQLGVTRSYSTNAVLVRKEPVAVGAKTTSENAAVEGSKEIASSKVAAVTTTPRQRRSKSAAEANPDVVDSTTTKAITVKTKEIVKKTTTTEEAAEALTTITPKKARRTKASATNIVSSATAAPVVPTQLRPYQEECIDTCIHNLEVKGIKRQIVSLPVGSGKTVIFSHLMNKVKPPFPGANKTLILAHRQELLEQTRNHVLRTGTGVTVTIDQGNRQADMTADVIVASVPSLGRAGTPRLLKYDPKEFKCIIIDEAHHAAAATYGRIMEYFGAHVPETHIFVYGCSATVRRHDGIKLGGVFDHISYHKSFINMIEEKWLCGLRVSTIKTDFDLRDVGMLSGDFAQRELSIKVNTPIRNDIIARSYMTYCKDRKSTVVFAVDIDHLETLTGVFREYGYDARGLSSKTDDGERAKMLREFREQKFPIIVNCGILTEGTDIPTIDSIIMARPTKSNVLFLQMVGRGMRLHQGKEDCLILDFVDVVKGEGLVTLPTLLGLDADSVLNKMASIKSQKDLDSILKDEIETIEQDPDLPQYPEESETVETVDPMTGVKVAKIRVLEYENPYQLLGDCSGMPGRFWGMSPNAWVSIGPDTFALSFKDATFRIEKSPEDGLYRCQKRVTLSKRKKDAAEASVKSFRNDDDNDSDNGRFKSKGTMLPIESDTLQDCFHGVDTWIAKNVGHYPQLIGRYARWRQLPASDQQLRFLRTLGYVHEKDYDMEGDDAAPKGRRQNERSLKKGEAANIITRLINGAGKRWEETKKFKIKRAKKLAKEIGVDVGPIRKF